jgi:hypothetical protein
MFFGFCMYNFLLFYIFRSHFRFLKQTYTCLSSNDSKKAFSEKIHFCLFLLLGVSFHFCIVRMKSHKKRFNEDLSIGCSQSLQRSLVLLVQFSVKSISDFMRFHFFLYKDILYWKKCFAILFISWFCPIILLFTVCFFFFFCLI